MDIEKTLKVLNIWKYFPNVTVDLNNSKLVNSSISIPVYIENFINSSVKKSPVVLESGSKYFTVSSYNLQFYIKKSVSQYLSKDFYISPIEVKKSDIDKNLKLFDYIVVSKDNYKSPVFPVDYKGNIKEFRNFNDYNNLTCNIKDNTFNDIKLNFVDISGVLKKLKYIYDKINKLENLLVKLPLLISQGIFENSFLLQKQQELENLKNKPKEIIENLLKMEIFKDVSNAIENNISDYTIGFIYMSNENLDMLKSIFSEIYNFKYSNNKNADIVFMDGNLIDKKDMEYFNIISILQFNGSFDSDTLSKKTLFYFPYWYKNEGSFENKLSSAKLYQYYNKIAKLFGLYMNDDMTFSEMDINSYLEYFVDKNVPLSLYLLYGFGLLPNELINFLGHDDSYIPFYLNADLSKSRVYNFVYEDGGYYVKDTDILISLIKLNHYIFQNFYQSIYSLQNNLSVVEKATGISQEKQRNLLSKLLNGDYKTVVEELQKNDSDNSNFLINLFSNCINISDIHNLMGNFNLFNSSFYKNKEKIFIDLNDVIIKNNNLNSLYMSVYENTIYKNSYISIENPFHNENIMVYCLYKPDNSGFWMKLLDNENFQISGNTNKNTDGAVAEHLHSLDSASTSISYVDNGYNEYIKIYSNINTIKIWNTSSIDLKNVKIIIVGYFS